MYINKKDAAFYCFEKVALAKVLGIRCSDNYIGEDGAKDLMQKISVSYGMRCPEFVKARKDSGFCYYRYHAIHFNPLWGLTTAIVLHEMAHAIHRFSGTGGEIHGAEYTRVWMDIISRMYECDVAELEQIARDRGLPFTPRIKVQPVTQYVPKYS